MKQAVWGIIGCAEFARSRAIPSMLATPSAWLKAVASRSPDRAEEFRQTFNIPVAYVGYENLLKDPEIEAVYLPLPNSLHAQWAIKAMQAGKHVLCEKPFVISQDEAKRVQKVSQRTGMKIMEAFMWRFHTQHLAARKRIDDGYLGQVRLVNGLFTFRLPREPNIRLDRMLGGGSIMDIGCYSISAMRYYFNAEPVEVYARGDIDPQFGVDMNAYGILEFPTGRGIFEAGFHLETRTRLEIIGDTGSIDIPSPWIPGENARYEINGTLEKCPLQDQYVSQFEEFSNSVLYDSPLPFGTEDAISQAKVMDAVMKSIRKRCVVRVA